jgi:hypothetical protein
MSEPDAKTPDEFLPDGFEPNPLNEEFQNDPERNRKASAREDLRQRFIEAALSTRDGREWMYDKLSRCHIYNTSFVVGDPHSTAFQEGERNIGLLLLAEIPPDVYALMLKEALNG